MNLFFECLPQDNSPIVPPKVSVKTSTKIARRKTRRGKKKKSPEALKWQLDKQKALELYKLQKKERANDFKNFARLIEKE